MRSPRETDLERAVCATAEGLGVLNIKLVKKAGYPDRLFFIPGGKPLLIEVKLPGEKPRELQDYIHEQLRAIGYDVEVHDTYLGALQAIASAIKRSPWSAQRLGPKSK